MSNKDSPGKDSNLNLSPARSEAKSRRRTSKKSQKRIRDLSAVCSSYSRANQDFSKLQKTSVGSAEMGSRVGQLKGFEVEGVDSNKDETNACGKCGNKVCRCLPRLMRKNHCEESPVRVNKEVHLLAPIYSGRSSTVLFDYPAQCQKPSRKNDRVFNGTDTELKSLSFKISDSVHTYNCMVNALSNAGFTQVQHSGYNLKVSGVPQPKILRKFNQYQKTNHFPGIWQIGRKDHLWRNVYRMRRKFGLDYEICPKTYILPEDYNRLQLELEADPKSLWILKPSASSCGRGIRLVNGSSHISKKQPHVVSKYVLNPHTINGFKYDLRIYVCVTSFDPLRIYVYEDGLVRFATEQYSPNKKTMKKRYVHLTNFSVNKRSDKFVKNQDACVDGEGSKWSLHALRKVFKEKGLDFEPIFGKIHDVIIKALISIEPHIVNTMNQTNKYRNMCFEVYGFDVLLDSDLRPWLLEVNVCPSLSSSSPLDKKIKTSLMCDVFNLVGFIPYDRKQHDKETEHQKISRLLGFEKVKILQRNLLALQSCKTLEDFPICEEDLEVLFDSEEESYRTGSFKRIFPLRTNIEYYSEFFDTPRYNNLLLWRYMKSPNNILLKFARPVFPFINN